MTMQDLTGQTLGQYELRELIGAGGMGAVYRGYQTALERAVAVKVLSTSLAEETGYVERFYREAKTSAALEHAHIVPVHDFGIQRDVSYVVMRLLTGGTLAERMARQSDLGKSLPSLGEIAGLLRQLGGALDYAHNQGVIHRDIKPSNIMFDNQGNAYLVDFGIAKLIAATSALTGTGTTMGTPAFMPPEQWRSEELTPAADQYALGATIYALMVGRIPYEATTPFGLMHKHINEMPTPPHVQRQDVPESVSIVIERVLAKQPEQRFPSVTAFAQAFEKAIQGQTGQQTGFFTMSMPRKAPPLPRTVVEPPATSPAATPAATPAAPTSAPPDAPTVTPVPPARLAEEPSMPVQIPTGARPVYRSPLVWLMAVALIAALAAIGVLMSDGGGDEPGPPTGTAVAGGGEASPVPPTGTDTPTLAPTDSPAPTSGPVVAVLPSDTPRPTATATVPTATPQPTDTPRPTRTPVPTATMTASPTDTPIPPSRTPVPTRTPRPTATPEPTEVAALPEGMPFASVSAEGAILYEEPDTNAPVVREAANEVFLVLAVTPARDWYQIDLGDRPAWLPHTPAVTVGGDLDAVPVFGASPGVVVVIGGGGAIMREGPNFDAPQIAVLSDVTLPVFATSEDGSWLRVEWEGHVGWVRRSSFVTVEGDVATLPVVMPGPGVVLGIGSLVTVMREGPNFDAPQIAALSDVRLPVYAISEDRHWFLVEWEGREGWVRRSSFVTVEGDVDALPVITPGPEVFLEVGHNGAQVREAPSFEAPVIHVVTDGRLPVLLATEDRLWFLVEGEGIEGWVRRSAFVIFDGDPDSVPVAEPGPTVFLTIGSVVTVIREGPAFDAPEIATLIDVVLPVFAASEDRGWFLVEWEGREGWVRRSAFVTIEGNVDALPVVVP